MVDTPDFLTLDDLIRVADGVLDKVLIRDHGLLASAAQRPQATVFGQDAYPRFETKAAALMHSLARTHPLVDGNKRLAWSATRTFYLLNGRDLDYTVDDAEALVIGVAEETNDVEAIATWLREHDTLRAAP